MHRMHGSWPAPDSQNPEEFWYQTPSTMGQHNKSCIQKHQPGPSNLQRRKAVFVAKPHVMLQTISRTSIAQPNTLELCTKNGEISVSNIRIFHGMFAQKKNPPINKNNKRQLKNPPVIDEFPIETSIYHGFPDYQRAIFHSYPMIPFMNFGFLTFTDIFHKNQFQVEFHLVWFQKNQKLCDFSTKILTSSPGSPDIKTASATAASVVFAARRSSSSLWKFRLRTHHPL